MAMEFGKLSKMSVGEVVTGVATEGGAVVAGLIGAGVVGKQIEKMVKVATPESSMTDKLLAYLGNNAPKLGLYYVLRKEGGKHLGGYEKDMGKGVLGSVVLDTLIRLDNNYAPKPAVSLFGIDFLGDKTLNSATPQMQQNMHKVLQENSSLRQQLNSALQRIASASPNVTVTPVQSATPIQSTATIRNARPIQTVTPIRSAQPPTVYAPPPPDHDRAYGMMQTTPEAENRRKNYGAMTPPIEDERNRRFGAMTPPIEDERNRRYGAMKSQYNFAGDTESVATAFGML